MVVHQEEAEEKYQEVVVVLLMVQLPVMVLAELALVVMLLDLQLYIMEHLLFLL